MFGQFYFYLLKFSSLQNFIKVQYQVIICLVVLLNFLME